MERTTEAVWNFGQDIKARIARDLGGDASPEALARVLGSLYAGALAQVLREQQVLSDEMEAVLDARGQDLKAQVRTITQALDRVEPPDVSPPPRPEAAGGGKSTAMTMDTMFHSPFTDAIGQVVRYYSEALGMETARLVEGLGMHVTEAVVRLAQERECSPAQVEELLDICCRNLRTTTWARLQLDA
jgi:hypothetical protein